jgi:hypothetical protein
MNLDNIDEMIDLAIERRPAIIDADPLYAAMLKLWYDDFVKTLHEHGVVVAMWEHIGVIFGKTSAARYAEISADQRAAMGDTAIECLFDVLTRYIAVSREAERAEQIS